MLRIIGHFIFYSLMFTALMHPLAAALVGVVLYGILRLVGFFDAPKATEYRR